MNPAGEERKAPAAQALAAALAALRAAQARDDALALEAAAAVLQNRLQALGPGLRADARAGLLDEAERHSLQALRPALAAQREDLARAQARVEHGLGLLLPRETPVYAFNGPSRPAGRGLLA